VKFIGARFGDDADESASVVAIFGIDVVRDDAEFSNGIEVRDSRGSVVAGLFDVSAVHHKAVGAFPLPVDGDISRGRTGTCAGADRIRNSARDGNDS
jgi:hypothetical protein